MTSKKLKICVIVLNWKRFSYTQRCLRSLEKVNYENLKIIVVDNHSCDGSIEALMEEFPHCIYIENEENLGFSAGINPGILSAMNMGADYVMILNNDMIVESDIFTESIAFLSENPDVGALTGKILFDDGSNRLWQAGGLINIYRAQGVPRGLGEEDLGQYDYIQKTGWASGAMSIFPRKTIQKIGLFPDEYYFGQEEWDYSVAILRAGLSIIYMPSFKGYHKAGGSYKANHPVLNIYGGYLNKIIFAKKYISPMLFPLWKLAFYLYLFIWFPNLARKYGKNKEEIKLIINSANMAFDDSRHIKKVTRLHLENASTRLGMTDGWG